MPFCKTKDIIIPENRFRIPTINDPEVIDMSKSIKDCGQLQPILVTKSKELIDGLTRLLACERLKKEVWYETEETAQLRLDNPLQRRRAEIQANIRRKDFTPLQLAKGIVEIDSLMREEYGSRRPGPGIQDGWTQTETAKMLGYKSASTVSDAITIVKAAETVDIAELEKARTLQEALKIAKGLSKKKKPAIKKKTFLPIEKNTYLFYKGLHFKVQTFNKEEEFENFICDNEKLIFGKNYYYLYAKRKIDNTVLGAIPDGYLLDYTDNNNPMLYIVEIDLISHGFDHIVKHINKTNIIIENYNKNIDIVEKYIPREIHLYLLKCRSKDNFGMLIILDKEDQMIDALFNSKPEGLRKFKIMSIESYKNLISDDIIFTKTVYFKETKKEKNGIVEVDL